MPTVRERLDADLKDAMRSKDELKLSVIRMAKSAIKYKEVEGANKVLDEAGILTVLTTMLKQRRDSIEQFTAGGRADLAEKEEKEVAIIQAYLPQQLTAAELTAEIAKAVTEAGAKGPKDMGAVMKIVTPRLKGQAEGKLISEEVKAQLAKLGG
ncbi:MAG: GatB/YqeY domain-containing protein [Archangiaceae bacterium]|nr:GatB/YqeY domain-containing protein [Archangiaceae bacterium]